MNGIGLPLVDIGVRRMQARQSTFMHYYVRNLYYILTFSVHHQRNDCVWAKWPGIAIDDVVTTTTTLCTRNKFLPAKIFLLFNHFSRDKMKENKSNVMRAPLKWKYAMYYEASQLESFMNSKYSWARDIARTMTVRSIGFVSRIGQHSTHYISLLQNGRHLEILFRCSLNGRSRPLQGKSERQTWTDDHEYSQRSWTVPDEYSHSRSPEQMSMSRVMSDCDQYVWVRRRRSTRVYL